VSINELKEAFNMSELAQNYPTASDTLDYSQSELQQKTPPLELLLKGEQLVIVPWTILMLKDARTWEFLGQFC
jgi:hypothetical protein